MKRKLSEVLVAVLVIAFVVLYSFNLLSTSYAKITVPDATSSFYVNDFVDVIPEAEETWLTNYSIELYEKYGAQLVLTTLDSLNNHTWYNVVNEIFKRYELSDMGLLIVFCNDTNQIYMKMGEKMETYVKSETQGYFVSEYFNPLARRGNLSQGFVELHRALRNEISARIEFEKTHSEKATIVTTSHYNLSASNNFSKSAMHMAFAFFLFFCIIIIVILIDVEKSNSKKILKRG